MVYQKLKSQKNSNMKVEICAALRKVFKNDRTLKKKFGNMTDKLKNLVAKLGSIQPHELFGLPGNPHHLRFQPKGVCSITVEHPFRCVFHLAEEKITILDIINYHDHSLRTYEI